MVSNTWHDYSLNKFIVQFWFKAFCFMLQAMFSFFMRIQQKSKKIEIENANAKCWCKYEKLREPIIKEICDRVYESLSILIAEVKNIQSQLWISWCGHLKWTDLIVTNNLKELPGFAPPLQSKPSSYVTLVSPVCSLLCKIVMVRDTMCCTIRGWFHTGITPRWFFNKEFSLG